MIIDLTNVGIEQKYGNSSVVREKKVTVNGRNLDYWSIQKNMSIDGYGSPYFHQIMVQNVQHLGLYPQTNFHLKWVICWPNNH